MKVEIDMVLCNGYASCTAAAPTVFELNDSGDFADVIQEFPGEELRAEVVEAVRICPKRAITIIETDVEPHIETNIEGA
jgi:ferredoxin